MTAFRIKKMWNILHNFILHVFHSPLPYCYFSRRKMSEIVKIKNISSIIDRSWIITIYVSSFFFNWIFLIENTILLFFIISPYRFSGFYSHDLISSKLTRKKYLYIIHKYKRIKHRISKRNINPSKAFSPFSLLISLIRSQFKAGWYSIQILNS